MTAPLRSRDGTGPASGQLASDDSRPVAVRLTRLAAWLIVVEAGIVMFAWVTGYQDSLTIGSGDSPIRFNAALCLGLYGAGVLTAAAGWRRSAFAAAGLGLAVSALTLFEYGSGSDLGIDDLFGVWQPDVAGDPRMAPHTAVCLTVAGLALLLTWWRRDRAIRQVVPVVASAVASVAVVALTGYATDLPAAYAWGPFTPMAPPTAVGLLLLSAALALPLWRRAEFERYGPRWLPVPVAAAVLAGAVILSHAINVHQRSQSQQWFEALVGTLATALQQSIEHQAWALEVLLDSDEPHDWQAKVAAFRAGHPSFLAAQLRSADGAPVVAAGDPRAIAVLAQQITAPLDGRLKHFSRSVLIAGAPATVFTTALQRADGSPMVFLGAVDLAKAVAPFVAEHLAFGRELVIYEDATILATASPSEPVAKTSWAGSTSIAMGDLRLRLELTPSSSGPIATRVQWARPVFVLGMGAILALLLGAVVGLVQSAYHANDQLSADIARRREIEQELRETRDVLERAQEVACLGSWQQGLGDTAARWSPQIVRILGLPDGTPPLDYDQTLQRIHEEDRDAVRVALGATIAGGAPFSRHFRIVQPDGTIRIVHGEAALFRIDGRPHRLNGMLHDVTEQRLAAEAVERNERLLNLVMETLPVGLIITDSTGRPTRMNPAARRIWNQTATVEPAHPSAYRGWLADTGHRLEPQDWTLIRSLQSLQPILGDVLEIECFDGARKTITNSAAPLLDREGRVIGGIVIEEDITGRRRAEAILAQRTQALERSNQELEQFAYVASHDLREPLRMISSYTQLLDRRYGSQLDNDAREFIGYAVDGAQRMQRLIGDLLALSRVGTVAFDMVPTDTNEVVARALASLQPAIAEAGALIDVEQMPQVKADAGQLEQVFQNLIGNALKFRGDEAVRVRLSATTAGGMVRFAVSDNGIGFEPAYADRIFVIFQRLHGPGQYPGTGIGLAVCRKIVQRHGGAVWAESEPGKGSCFFFTIPAVNSRTGEQRPLGSAA